MINQDVKNYKSKTFVGRLFSLFSVQKRDFMQEYLADQTKQNQREAIHFAKMPFLMARKSN